MARPTKRQAEGYTLLFLFALFLIISIISNGLLTTIVTVIWILILILMVEGAIRLARRFGR